MTELEEHVMEKEELKTEIERMARKQLKKKKTNKDLRHSSHSDNYCIGGIACWPEPD